MSLNVLKPYIKRLKRTRPSITAWVFEHNESSRKELEDLDVIDDFNSNNYDVCVIGYNKVDLTPDMWNKLNPNGWFAVKDTVNNLPAIVTFRRNNKITSLLSRVDGWIFFQKEDYSDRMPDAISKQDESVELQSVPTDLDDSSTVNEAEIPNWLLSPFNVDFLNRVALGNIFVTTQIGEGSKLHMNGGEILEVARRSNFAEIVGIEPNENKYYNAIRAFDYDPRITILNGPVFDMFNEVFAEKLVNTEATVVLDANQEHFDEMLTRLLTDSFKYAIVIVNAGDDMLVENLIAGRKLIRAGNDVIVLTQNTAALLSFTSNGTIRKETPPVDNSELPDEIKKYFGTTDVPKEAPKKKSPIIFL